MNYLYLSVFSALFATSAQAQPITLSADDQTPFISHFLFAKLRYDSREQNSGASKP